MIIYTSLLTIKILRNIARINNIKYISNYKKQKLLNFLFLHKTITYIQRFYRRKIMKDNICPISFETLKYPFVSIKIDKNNFNYYDFKTIVDYFQTTGDFRDPMTRKDISDEKIKEINKLINYYYRRNSIKNLWSKSMILRAEFITISNCINQLFGEINNMEYIRIDFIYSLLFPQLLYYFQHLLSRHRESCNFLILHCIHVINNHTCDNKYII